MSRLDAARVLAALPGTMPLAWTLPLVSAALAWGSESRRTLMVTKQLRRCAWGPTLTHALACTPLVTPRSARGN